MMGVSGYSQTTRRRMVELYAVYISQVEVEVTYNIGVAAVQTLQTRPELAVAFT